MAHMFLREEIEPSRFKHHFSFTESRSQMPNKKRHGSLGTWPIPPSQEGHRGRPGLLSSARSARLQPPAPRPSWIPSRGIVGLAPSSRDYKSRTDSGHSVRCIRRKGGCRTDHTIAVLAAVPRLPAPLLVLPLRVDRAHSPVVVSDWPRTPPS